MAMNQPNPQRGTERRGNTGVRPAPAPAAAPAAQGGANRPTGRRPGAPAPGRHKHGEDQLRRVARCHFNGHRPDRS